MTSILPHIMMQTVPNGLRVTLSGDWSAAAMAHQAAWSLIQSLQPSLQQVAHHAGWDLSAVTRLDHTGAQWLWNTWQRKWPDQVQLSPIQRAMIERAQRWSPILTVEVEHARSSNVLQALSGTVAGWKQHAADALRLLGQLALDGGRLLRAPRQAPWRDISGHLYHIGATALPITAMVGFLIGVVLAYLMSQQLRQFGANIFLVNILGIALIRELGPVLAAILIAGRSGSAMTAQLGVMRVTEELDAMRVMGIPKGYRLVMPRALAMLIAMPLISLWTTVAALIGGMVAAEFAMGLSPAYFFHALPNAVKLSNLWLATAKAAVFGLMIALIACHYGLRVKPNTQSLGEGTTASVVSSITMVIVVDALFAIVFKNVGL
jgi:phospholipid/cholesterol/gamma-HCH transport system permease protein